MIEFEKGDKKANQKQCFPSAKKRLTIENVEK